MAVDKNKIGQIILAIKKNSLERKALYEALEAAKADAEPDERVVINDLCHNEPGSEKFCVAAITILK